MSYHMIKLSMYLSRILELDIPVRFSSIVIESEFLLLKIIISLSISLESLVEDERKLLNFGMSLSVSSSSALSSENVRTSNSDSEKASKIKC